MMAEDHLLWRSHEERTNSVVTAAYLMQKSDKQENEVQVVTLG